MSTSYSAIVALTGLATAAFSTDTTTSMPQRVSVTLESHVAPDAAYYKNLTATFNPAVGRIGFCLDHILRLDTPSSSINSPIVQHYLNDVPQRDQIRDAVIQYTADHVYQLKHTGKCGTELKVSFPVQQRLLLEAFDAKDLPKANSSTDAFLPLYPASPGPN